MKRKKRVIAILLLCFIPVFPSAAYSDLPEVDIQSRSAILVHAQTDEILFAHNVHIRREPASITKVITALLALELGDLDDIVTAGEEDFFDITAQSSAISPVIQPGEEMTLRDLIYSAMVASDNSSCNIIARHIAGSVPAFMEMVNARLADLGCENSRFTNPHGLPDDNHYTTAYDVYLMGRECVTNTVFMEIANTETYTMGPTNKAPDGRSLSTTNQLKRRRSDYYYEYARGIKTGRTNNAGHCLLSTAERDGITLISVVLGAFTEEETNLVRSFTETRDLFEWGFANFTVKTILSRTNQLAGVPVLQGKDQDEVFLVPERSVEALIPKYLNAEDIVRTITVFEPGGIQAPVTAGDILGEVALSYQGHDYGTIPLVANKDVEHDTREAIQEGIGVVISSILEPGGSLSWIKWTVLGAVTLIGLYVVFVVTLNRRRRRRNMRSRNYRGRRRY